METPELKDSQSCSSTLMVSNDTTKPDLTMDEMPKNEKSIKKIYEYSIAKQMKHNSSVLVVGPRDSGKSTSIRHMAYEMKFKQIHVVTGSRKDQEFHQRYISHKNVLYGWSYGEQSMVENLIETQHKRRKALTTVGQQSNCVEKQTNPLGFDVDYGLEKTAIAFDSFGYDNHVMDCKQLMDLVMNGRMYNTWVGITLQCGQQLPKQLRGNMDVLIFFETRSRDERMFLYKHYTSFFSSFQEFNEYFDACTSNGGAMVIDNTVKSDKLTDKVFWYKPRQYLPKFMVGDDGHRVEADLQAENKEHTNGSDDKSFSKAQPTCSFPSTIKSVFSCLSFWIDPSSSKHVS